MSTTRIGDAAVITLPSPEWGELTDQNEGIPSFYKEEGAGALQFTIATFRDGPEPQPSDADLRDLSHRQAQKLRFEAPLEEGFLQHGPIRWLRAMHRRDDDTRWRTWLGSDGRSVAWVTYVSNWDGRDLAEEAEVDAIIASFRFTHGPAHALRKAG